MKMDRRKAVKLLGGVGAACLPIAQGAFANSVLANMSAAGEASDPDFMVLLIYTPRADSEDRGYSKWLQDIDMPFFNNVPEIHHYSNWLVTGGSSPAFPYGYFDFMVCNDRAAFDAAWARPDVAEFAGGWTVDWGQYPEATPEAMSDNYHVYICQRISPSVSAKTHALEFTPLAEAPDISESPDNTETWKITESILGVPHFQFFQVQYHEPGAENGVSDGALQAMVIASPD